MTTDKTTRIFCDFVRSVEFIRALFYHDNRYLVMCGGAAFHTDEETAEQWVSVKGVKVVPLPTLIEGDRTTIMSIYRAEVVRSDNPLPPVQWLHDNRGLIAPYIALAHRLAGL